MSVALRQAPSANIVTPFRNRSKSNHQGVRSMKLTGSSTRAIVALAGLALSVTRGARLAAEPASLKLRAGDSTAVTVRAYNAGGRELPNAVVRVFGARRGVAYDEGK